MSLVNSYSKKHTMEKQTTELRAELSGARSQALFNGAFNLGVSGSAFAFGLVAEQWGYRTMFSIAALTPGAAAVLFLVGTRRRAAAG